MVDFFYANKLIKFSKKMKVIKEDL